LAKNEYKLETAANGFVRSSELRPARWRFELVLLDLRFATIAAQG
jgi:hypothetical protein